MVKCTISYLHLFILFLLFSQQGRGHPHVEDPQDGHRVHQGRQNRRQRKHLHKNRRQSRNQGRHHVQERLVFC